MSQELKANSQEPHSHFWPKNGAGCWCGARVQCAKTTIEPALKGLRERVVRCSNAALPGVQRCAEHGGVAAKESA